MKDIIYCDICKNEIIDIDFHSDDAGEYHDDCREEWFKSEAISHGIPRDVVEGKKKLSDYFSKEYIDFKCNRSKICLTEEE